MTDEEIQVSGYYAAYQATLSAGSRITANAHYALAFATMESVPQQSITLKLSGHLTAYGATFICKADSSGCTVDCTGTACRNMDYVCLAGASCSIRPSGCVLLNGGKVAGIECPNWLTSIPLNKDYENDEVYQQIESDIKQNEELYESFDDYKYYSNEFDLDDDEMELFGEIGAILRSGDDSGYGIKEIFFGCCIIIFVIGILGYVMYSIKKSEKSNSYTQLQ